MATPVMQINHTTIPSAEPYRMGTGGRYLAKPPATVRQNGLGIDVVAGYSSVEWSWDAISMDDYLWWYTILLGQPSQLFSHAYLYNHVGTLTTYSNAIVHRPSFEYVQGDTYFNVKLVIDQLI